MRNKEIQIFNPPLSQEFGYSGFNAARKLGSKARELIEIWQAYIPHCRGISETKCKIALCVFARSFGANKSKWKDFCKYISQSKKLMGGGRKKLKVSLGWAVQGENLRKILQGKYHTEEEAKSARAEQLIKGVAV